MGVWNETGRVLERAPGNARALAYQSLVRLAMGQVDVAATMLTKALAADPDLVEGYAYLALAYVRMGRMRDAEGAIAKASKRFPERAADLRRYLTDLKGGTPVAQAGAGSGAPDPHAGLGTPGEGAPQKSVTTDRRVSGTVDVDPSLTGKLPPGGILFVFARAAGVGAGPPVAVKRLPARFPAAFELSEADSMMGQPLPDLLLIEARLDEDGDPTTRSPSDPKARLDGVKLGRADVRLVLKRP
jgi:tetratricopeptide (TPR) repeat protein